ncbi:MAG: glutaredoxin domain-containing protein [Rickettsiaceae bacterium]
MKRNRYQKQKRSLLLLPILSILLFAFFFYKYQKSETSLQISEPTNECQIQVRLYTKSWCSYCNNAKKLLDSKNIGYCNIDISNNKKQHQKLYLQTSSKTVPYIFINNQYIGGYQDLIQLQNEGRLQKLMCHNEINKEE